MKVRDLALQAGRTTAYATEDMSQRRDTSGPSQAHEFQIWAGLINQSHGLLHPFLPLLDRGLDAVLHHMVNGRYIPVQVKRPRCLGQRNGQVPDRGRQPR